jgi:hypothetical protein
MTPRRRKTARLEIISMVSKGNISCMRTPFHGPIH